MNAPPKILIVRLSALGDILLATPVARLLAARFPGARIDWLVESAYLPLLEGNPLVHALAYDKRGADAGLSGLWALRGRLAETGYDLVVDLQNKPKTALLRGVGRAHLVFRKRTAANALSALLGRDPPLVRAHAVDLFTEALAPLGLSAEFCSRQDQAPLTPELHLTDGMRAEAVSLAAGSRPLVGLAPGTRWATKCWPIDRFAELARALSERGRELLLIGSAEDAARFERIRAAVPEQSAWRDTSRLTVGGLAAAIAHCALVVSGDSGPAHIAAALGVPTLTLFGPTSPKRWAPRGKRAAHLELALDCSPCSNHGGHRCPLGTHACLAGLSVERVLARALTLLEPGGEALA